MLRRIDRHGSRWLRQPMLRSWRGPFCEVEAPLGVEAHVGCNFEGHHDGGLAVARDDFAHVARIAGSEETAEPQQYCDLADACARRDLPEVLLDAAEIIVGKNDRRQQETVSGRQDLQSQCQLARADRRYVAGVRGCRSTVQSMRLSWRSIPAWRNVSGLAEYGQGVPCRRMISFGLRDSTRKSTSIPKRCPFGLRISDFANRYFRPSVALITPDPMSS